MSSVAVKKCINFEKQPERCHGDVFRVLRPSFMKGGMWCKLGVHSLIDGVVNRELGSVSVDILASVATIYIYFIYLSLMNPQRGLPWSPRLCLAPVQPCSLGSQTGGNGHISTVLWQSSDAEVQQKAQAKRRKACLCGN